MKHMHSSDSPVENSSEHRFDAASPLPAMLQRTPKPTGRLWRPQAPQEALGALGLAAFSHHLGRPRAANPWTAFVIGFVFLVRLESMLSDSAILLAGRSACLVERISKAGQ